MKIQLLYVALLTSAIAFGAQAPEKPKQSAFAKFALQIKSLGKKKEPQKLHDGILRGPGEKITNANADDSRHVGTGGDRFDSGVVKYHAEEITAKNCDDGEEV